MKPPKPIDHMGRVRSRSYGRPTKPREEYKYPYRRLDGQRAHRVIVEARTGFKLPASAIVHHVDPNDKWTNQGHFVVCQDQAYHALIEYRGKALRECGNANWMRCYRCGKWDEPGNVIPSPRRKRRRGTFGDVVHPKRDGQCFVPEHPIPRGAYTCPASASGRHKVPALPRGKRTYVRRTYVRHGLEAVCGRCKKPVRRPHDRSLRWHSIA